ncbi:helix-turn-helix domain-containing protein [Thalassotalea euphylliae]|uniref:AraC family transcriptional regulator n=1 Tax=Thalassotalea euphylliae TaxID=1655234 RepID=UPI00364336AC
MTVQHIHKAYVLMALSLDLAPVEKILENSRFSLLDGSWQAALMQEAISVTDAIVFVENIEKYAEKPEYAAIYGAHLGAASHGPVGYATLSAPTIGEALSTFLTWFHIRCDVYKARVSVIENYVEIAIKDTSNSQIFKTFFFEALSRALEVIVTFLTGHVPENRSLIYFESNAVDKQLLLEQQFDAKLVFSASQNKILIPLSVWHSPSPLHDPVSYDFNISQCEKLQQTQNASHAIDVKVKQLIHQHINDVINQSKEPSPISQVLVSEQLNMHERTLIRHLKRRNTSFKGLLEEERKRVASNLLKQAQYTVYDIANLLGYRESANFCRAFKHWYQCTPTEFRRKQQP